MCTHAQQKLTQHCKAIIFQFLKSILKRNKSVNKTEKKKRKEKEGMERNKFQNLSRKRHRGCYAQCCNITRLCDRTSVSLFTCSTSCNDSHCCPPQLDLISWMSVFFKYLFIHLAALGLNCSMQTL